MVRSRYRRPLPPTRRPAAAPRFRPACVPQGPRSTRREAAEDGHFRRSGVSLGLWSAVALAGAARGRCGRLFSSVRCRATVGGLGAPCGDVCSVSCVRSSVFGRGARGVARGPTGRQSGGALAHAAGSRYRRPLALVWRPVAVSRFRSACGPEGPWPVRREVAVGGYFRRSGAGRLSGVWVSFPETFARLVALGQVFSGGVPGGAALGSTGPQSGGTSAAAAGSRYRRPLPPTRRPAAAPRSRPPAPLLNRAEGARRKPHPTEPSTSAPSGPDSCHPGHPSRPGRTAPDTRTAPDSRTAMTWGVTRETLVSAGTPPVVTRTRRVSRDTPHTRDPAPGPQAGTLAPKPGPGPPVPGPGAGRAASGSARTAGLRLGPPGPSLGPGQPLSGPVRASPSQPRFGPAPLRAGSGQPLAGQDAQAPAHGQPRSGSG